MISETRRRLQTKQRKIKDIWKSIWEPGQVLPDTLKVHLGPTCFSLLLLLFFFFTLFFYSYFLIFALAFPTAPTYLSSSLTVSVCWAPTLTFPLVTLFQHDLPLLSDFYLLVCSLIIMVDGTIWPISSCQRIHLPHA